LTNSNADELSYEVKEYEGGFIGICIEIPCILAQAKTKEELDRILKNMTRSYFSIVESKLANQHQLSSGN
jgi:predicted RNase H-like HicB family nuclease